MNLSLFFPFVLSLFIYFFSENSLQINATAPAQSPLVIKHLTGDVYVYTTYNRYKGELFPSNSLYLLTSQGAVLLDTPWDKTQFQPLLDSIQHKHNTKVVLCISTHYHTDRTAGLDYYKQQGIKTYSSKLTYDLCKTHNNPQAENYFRTDTTFQVGNHQIQAFYPGEGHSKDNIVVWMPKEKVLYGGCLIKSTETQDMGNLSDANLAAWPATIRNVQKQFPNPSFVIPGHQSWENKKSLAHTLHLLETHTKKK
jgi:glyoxylase-like metal-dependent hydrolase (beta-lactamase superfamily II)